MDHTYTTTTQDSAHGSTLAVDFGAKTLTNLVNCAIIAQSTEHRAQSTEHRAQSTEHRAQTKSVCLLCPKIKYAEPRR